MSMLAALVVLSVSGRAAAAGNPAVPMCGERNESVAAPPIFRGSHSGSLRASPCQAPDQLGVSPNAPPAPERVNVQPRPERALAFGSLCITQSASSRVSIVAASRALERPGCVGTLFRPPQG